MTTAILTPTTLPPVVSLPGRNRRQIPPGAITARQALWIAAGDIPKSDRRPDGSFSLQALAVRAWELWEDVFGLPGYVSESCDMRKVSAAVYGRRGMIALGHLVRVDGGLLMRGSDPEAFASPAVTSEVQRIEDERRREALDESLKPLTEMQAFRLFASGKKQTILRSTAEFWWAKLGGRDKVAELLRDRETPLAREVGAAHDWLVGKFGGDDR